jgi:sugar lactone lactonase YvrE
MGDTTILLEGLYFGEGPRWHEGRLWFSDFYAHAVKSVDEAGAVRIELELDDQPSGLGWLPDGRLLVVAMKARAIKRLDATGLVLHADISHLTAHLCNDMVVDAQGTAWVGNFGFDLDAELRARGGDVLSDHPVTNLVRVDTDGSAHLAAADMHFPNGSVITPDGRTLIVAETLAGCLTAFTINAGQDRSRSVVSGRRSPASPPTASAWMKTGRCGWPMPWRLKWFTWPRAGRSPGASPPANPATPVCWAALTAKRCSR